MKDKFVKNLSRLIQSYNASEAVFIDLMLEAYKTAVEAADPYKACLSQFRLENNTLLFQSKAFNLALYGHIYLAGAGKAGYKMAKAIYDLLGSRITQGCVAMPYNSSMPKASLGNISFIQAAHPVPDINSVKAAKTISELLLKANSNDLIVFLLSGGASSLMCLPIDGIALEEKQRINDLLLKSGGSISEINIVRKQLSALKGGKLAKLAYPAQMIQLVLSDVMGNPLEIIGSGPGVPNDSSAEDAICVLKKYSLWDSIPQSVVKLLSSKLYKTAKNEETPLTQTFTSIVADNSIAITAVAKHLTKLNLKAYVYPDSIIKECSLEANDFFLYVSALERENHDSFAVIAGGEPVVDLKKSKNSSKTSSGGRAQEFLLSVLKFFSESPELHGRNFFMLAAGTDGIDGPTDAAGAIATHKTLQIAEAKSHSIKDFLDTHSSYGFFNKIGGLIKTGYTGTNVNDVYILLMLPKTN